MTRPKLSVQGFEQGVSGHVPTREIPPCHWLDLFVEGMPSGVACIMVQPADSHGGLVIVQVNTDDSRVILARVNPVGTFHAYHPAP